MQPCVIRRVAVTLAMAVTAVVLGTGCSTMQQADEKLRAETSQLLDRTLELVAVEIATPRLEGVRSLVGAGRAVVIVPAYYHGGLLLGYGRGKGVVLKRHGKRWSDPLFVSNSEVDFGLQIGFHKSRILALILTENAVNKIAKGTAHWGTAGSFSFLNWGLDAAGTASWDSGLDSTVVAFSKGLYFGATFTRARLVPHAEFNRLFYGDKSASDILATPGNHPATVKLRNRLMSIMEEHLKE